MNDPVIPTAPRGANSFRSGPDGNGRFGAFGGRFVAETLMPLILEVEQAYTAARADPAFQAELDGYLKHYVGRPSPLWFAERLTRALGGARVYLSAFGNTTRPLSFIVARTSSTVVFMSQV